MANKSRKSIYLGNKHIESLSVSNFDTRPKKNFYIEKGRVQKNIPGLSKTGSFSPKKPFWAPSC